MVFIYVKIYVWYIFYINLLGSRDQTVRFSSRDMLAYIHKAFQSFPLPKIIKTGCSSTGSRLSSTVHAGEYDTVIRKNRQLCTDWRGKLCVFCHEKGDRGARQEMLQDFMSVYNHCMFLITKNYPCVYQYFRWTLLQTQYFLYVLPKRDTERPESKVPWRTTSEIR